MKTDILEIIDQICCNYMMNSICVGDRDIPVLMEIASENQSDKEMVRSFI
jgi:hypothetical protein